MSQAVEGIRLQKNKEPVSVRSKFYYWLEGLNSRDEKNNYNALEETIYQNIGFDISPNLTRYGGLAALFTSSDQVARPFFDRTKTLNPNGYIVGVGAGGIFALLDCYSCGQLPKGIVVSDINPFVVAAVRVMREDLIKSSTANEFVERFFQCSDAEYRKKQERVKSKDKNLKNGIKRWTLDSSTPMEEWRRMEVRGQNTFSDSITVPYIVGTNFLKLQELAKSGGIAACYADFMNPDFIDSVRQLPDFVESRNIIYISNVIDLHRTSTSDYRDGSYFSRLRRYEIDKYLPIFVCAPRVRNDLLQSERTFLDVLKHYYLEDYISQKKNATASNTVRIFSS